MKAQGTELKDARIVFFGAGSSAVGVAKSIASVIELKGGVSAEDAKKVWIVMSRLCRLCCTIICTDCSALNACYSLDLCPPLPESGNSNCMLPKMGEQLRQQGDCSKLVQAVFLVDTKGLITDSRGDEKPEHKKVFMRTDGTPDMKVRGC
jgi:malic enzyme